MSPKINSKDVIKNKILVGGENSEIHTLGNVDNVNYFGNLSEEANELLMRLNKLANSHPFNIMYKAKIYDTR
jgi:hypothetical protein